MSREPYVCGKKDLHMPECDDCSELESRVERLEECCEDVHEELDNKQDILISGVNIKTINHETLIGDGNIDIPTGGDTVDYTQTLTSGTEVGTITINGVTQSIYAPQGGGGDTVSYTQTLTSGTESGVITINGTSQSIYSTPDTHHTGYLRAGASGGTANAAENNPYLNYVENGENRSGVRLIGGENVTIASDANGNVTINSSGGGGSGDAVSYVQTLTSGNECGTITINSVSQKIYSPSLKTINGVSIIGTGNITTPDTDTHYTGYLRAGSSTSTSNASATNPYINFVENGSLRSGVRLYGGANITISSNSSGTITIDASTGGDTVSYTSNQSTGDTLGTITINGSTKYIRGQEKLVSGTNIKTINGLNILGSGNLPLLKRTTDYVDNLTVDPNTDFHVDFAPAHPAGYTRIGVVGWDISNATSSGKNVSHCAIRSIWPDGSENVKVEIGNFGTTSAKIKITIYILWVYGALY